MTEMNARGNIGNFEPASFSRGAVSSVSHSSQLPERQPGRLISLAFLSAGIPEDRIAGHLARMLAAETGRATLLVRFTTHDSKVSLADWGRLAQQINGEFCFQRQLENNGDEARELTVRLAGDPGDTALLVPMFAHFREHFAYVLVQIPAEADALHRQEMLAHSHSSFLVLRPGASDLQQLAHLACGVRSLSAEAFFHLKPVLFLEAEEAAHNFTDQLNQNLRTPCLLGSEEHLPSHIAEVRYLRDRRGTFDRHVRSLAREIAGTRVGLVLSSGSARGLAHVGVIQVLEENGIEVDVIAGSSMGAYVASVWAAGKDGSDMEKLAREVESRWGLLKLIDPVLPPSRGFIHGRAAIRHLKHAIGDIHFSDLERPLRIVSTNLLTLDRVVFSSGEVAAAVHASIAIPGVFVPVQLDGETYVDGGVTDPMPVDVLKDMGVEKIIGVNTIPTPAYLQCCRELEREQAEVRRPRRVFRFFNRRVNYFAPGNILDTLMRAVHGSQVRVAEASCRQVDVLLRPLACDARWHDFTHPVKYIAQGRHVAEEYLDEIKALVKGRSHETRTTPGSMAVAA